jgi:glycosyltransferase involved in cell wall biosynthesis
MVFLCGFQFGIENFYTIHNIDPAMHSQGLKAWWRRKEFARAVKNSQCRMLAVSRSAADSIANGIGLDRNAISVPGNPIDLNKWQPPNNPLPSKIIMIATLKNYKRVHIGIQAVKILSGTFPAARLEIVGDGPERANLEELVRSLGLQERVSFLGVRRDIPELLKVSGILWLLSEREGMPMVMLEAMASGVPVVATDKPGTNEFVRDGDNGLLVPLDDPQAVAEATSRIWLDTHLRERLRANGLIYVKQFALPNIVKQHLAHYKSITARP